MRSVLAILLIDEVVSTGPAVERNLANPSQGELNLSCLESLLTHFKKAYILKISITRKSTRKVGLSTVQ